MPQIKIDRQSKLFYIAVPDQRFYTRNIEVPEGVPEALEAFYKHQDQIESWLKVLYSSAELGGDALPIPEIIQDWAGLNAKEEEVEKKKQNKAKSVRGQDRAKTE